MRRLPRHCSHAFTLIELLVSTAVALLVFTLLAGVVSAVSEVTSRTERNDRALADGRGALDLLGFDLRGVLNRKDIPWKQGGLGFFTGRPAWDGGRGISAVVYRHDPDKGLIRDSMGVPWTEGDTRPFDTDFPGVPEQGEVIGENILAWDVTYVDRKTGGMFRAGNRPDEIGGLVVTAVVLDRDFRKRLSPQDLARLRAEFVAPEPETPTATVWNEKATALASSSGTFSTLRVIQKAVFLP